MCFTLVTMYRASRSQKIFWRHTLVQKAFLQATQKYTFSKKNRPFRKSRLFENVFWQWEVMPENVF